MTQSCLATSAGAHRAPQRRRLADVFCGLTAHMGPMLAYALRVMRLMKPRFCCHRPQA